MTRMCSSASQDMLRRSGRTHLAEPHGTSVGSDVSILATGVKMGLGARLEADGSRRIEMGQHLRAMSE